MLRLPKLRPVLSTVIILYSHKLMVAFLYKIHIKTSPRLGALWHDDEAGHVTRGMVVREKVGNYIPASGMFTQTNCYLNMSAGMLISVRVPSGPNFADSHSIPSVTLNSIIAEIIWIISNCVTKYISVGYNNQNLSTKWLRFGRLPLYSVPNVTFVLPRSREYG